MSVFTEYRSLTSVDVNRNNITGDGAQQLATAALDKPSLKSFCGIPLKELRADSLSELNLKDKGVGVPGALVIAHFLRVSRSLTAVDTRRNEIKGEGAEQLAAAVLGSSSMVTFGDVPIQELRADALTTLDLSSKWLGSTEALVLAGLLPVSRSLAVADLRFNQLDTESATMLATIAKEKKISLCGITPDQTEANLQGPRRRWHADESC